MAAQIGKGGDPTRRVALSLGSVLLFEDDVGKAAVNPLLAIVMSMTTLGFYWFAISRIIAAQASVHVRSILSS